MPQGECTGNGLSSASIFGIALAVYIVWTVVTYLLEGRIHLLIEGDPVSRIVYALIANILIGTLLVLVIVAIFQRCKGIERSFFGFQPATKTIVSILAAFILGSIVFVLQSPRTLDPVVLLNVFAQVFTTSTAEILVNYVLVGITASYLSRSWGRIPSTIVGIVLAAVLFGLYHLAHSPPFNTVPLILVLTIVGVVTGVFFFLVREIYSTIVFHNFLALFGVMQNIDLASFAPPNVPLLAMMLVTLVVLAGTDVALIRGSKG